MNIAGVNIPDDALACITYNFSIKDVNALTLVSKGFNTFVESNDKKLYPEEFIIFKKCLRESLVVYQDNKTQMEGLTARLEEQQNVNDKLIEIQKQINSKPFYALCQESSQFLSIANAITCIFPCIKTDIDSLNTLEEQVKQLKSKKIDQVTEDQLRQELEQLKNTLTTISVAHKDEIKIILAFEKMKSLVGGWQEYEKLPVLDIGEERREDYIHIGFNELTAPIMRGVDCYKRPFFTIRFMKKEADDGAPLSYVDTFFQRYRNGNSWSNTVAGVMKFVRGHIINRGTMDYPQDFARVAEIIKTRKVTEFDGTYVIA